MSEKRAPEPDRMERLMELQSRLRELTEEKKARWERLGQPLPEVESVRMPVRSPAPAGRDRPPQLANSPGPLDHPGPPDSPGTSSRPDVAAAASTPITHGRTAASGAPTREATGTQAGTAAQPASSGGPPPSAEEPPRFARRRGTSSGKAREASKLWAAARATARAAWAFTRRSIEQVGDLTGALGAHGAHKAKPKVRPGDPITAEDLINDRSLSARLLGAAVFFVGLVAIGTVALIQLGKLQVPWLENNALPAATGAAEVRPVRSAPGSGAADREAAPEPRAGDEPGDRPYGEEGEEAAEPVAGAGAAGSRSAEAGAGVGAAGDLAGALGGSADSRQSRDFDRLRGELAFRLGEYEIVRAEFERGGAGCDELTSHYRRVDDAHLLVSRVVARWREVPWSQVKAYDELSESVDRVLMDYSTSGCGLEESQLPPSH